MVNSRQFTVQHKVGLFRGLHNQFITAHNRKPPWLTNALACTVCKIEHHDAVSSGIFAYEFHPNPSWEWMKQAFITLMEATETYMVEVIAESHC